MVAFSDAADGAATATRATIVTLSDFVPMAPRLSVNCTVNAHALQTAVGAPVRAPVVELKLSPAAVSAAPPAVIVHGFDAAGVPDPPSNANAPEVYAAWVTSPVASGDAVVIAIGTVIVTAVALAPDEPMPASVTFALKDPVVAFVGTFPAHTAPVPLLKFTHAGKLPDVTISVKGGVPPVTSTGHACPIVAVSVVAIVGSATTVMLIGVSAAPLTLNVTGIITGAADAGAVYVAVVVVVPLAVIVCALPTVPHPLADGGVPHVGVPNITPLSLESFVTVAVRVVCPFASTCAKEELLLTVIVAAPPLPPPQFVRPTIIASPKAAIAIRSITVLITFLLKCVLNSICAARCLLGPGPRAEAAGKVP